MNLTDQEKEQLYRDYYGKIHGYLRSHLTDAETAEDLTSDVFLKVYDKLDTFDEAKASLSTWIYTIARNTLTDFFRTHRLMDEVPETFSDGSDVEDEFCTRESLAALSAALKKLPERERDILVLRFYSGKTLKEIAEGMDISYAYVKVLQNKALDMMKNLLGEV